VDGNAVLPLASVLHVDIEAIALVYKFIEECARVGFLSCYNHVILYYLNRLLPYPLLRLQGR
jgi:hypothetical protein